MTQIDPEKCYYFSQNRGCLKELIEFGFPFYCCRSQHCPDYSDRDKDEYINRIDSPLP